MKKKLHIRWAAAVLLAVTWWSYVSVHIQELEVPVGGLPPAFDGMRIVLLTDLHGRAYGAAYADLLQAVERAKPDLIAVAGDLADSRTDLSKLEPLVRGLCGLAPVYFVTGNHEWDGVDTERLLTSLADWGAVVLRNEYTRLTDGSERIILAGAEDPNGPWDMETPRQLVQRIRQEQGETVPLLLLYHRNDALRQWADLGVDVVLSGHGHGGGIRLPLVGGLVGTDRRFLPDYTGGIYTLGGTTMVVSRGLGGIRLWNRPHLPVLILKEAVKEL